MTVAVANTANTNTVQYWRTRTNELAGAMSTVVVTVNSNSAVGNASIIGSIEVNTARVQTISGGNNTSTANLAVSSNAVFAAVVDLGYGANVIVRTGNSTVRVLAVNSAAGFSTYATKITFADHSDANVVSTPANGTVLTFIASQNAWTAGLAPVSGTDTQVQFNDGGVLNGTGGLTFAKTSNTLTVANTIAAITVSATTVTANVVANTASLTTSAVVGSGTSNVQVVPTSVLVQNSTVAATMNTLNYAIGNSTVNAILTSTSLKLANSTSNATFTIPTAADWALGTKYLNANGSWSLPPVVAPGGFNTNVQWNNAGVFDGLTNTSLTTLVNSVVGDSGSGGTKGLVPAPAAGDAAAGKFLKADGTWLVPPLSSLGPHVIIEDQKASGTGPGAFGTSPVQRNLNTLAYNHGSLASLTSNQFTLPAGTYYISFWTAFSGVSQPSIARAYIKNVTDTTYPILGPRVSAGVYYNVSGSNDVGFTCTGAGVFTIAASKTFELDMTINGGAGGVAIGDGRNEVYSHVEITKLS